MAGYMMPLLALALLLAELKLLDFIFVIETIQEKRQLSCSTVRDRTWCPCLAVVLHSRKRRW